MICVRDSDRRTFDSECQIGIAKRRFRDSGLRISVSKLQKIDCCSHDVTHPGREPHMSCVMMQQIREELGSRDGLGHSLPSLPKIASNLHHGHIPRNQADLSCSQITLILTALRATQVTSSQFMLTRFGMRIYRFRNKIRRFRRERRFDCR